MSESDGPSVIRFRKHKYFLFHNIEAFFCRPLPFRQSQSYQVIASRFPHHAIYLSVSDSSPPHHSEQPNTATLAVFTEQWTCLLLACARHRGLFVLRIEDTEVSGGEWGEVLRNPRINRTSSVFFFCCFPPSARSFPIPGTFAFGGLFLLSSAVRGNLVCDALQGD